MELHRNITTARELLEVLKSLPDYALDINIELVNEDTDDVFEMSSFEAFDLIEDGNRNVGIRISG